MIFVKWPAVVIASNLLIGVGGASAPFTAKMSIILPINRRVTKEMQIIRETIDTIDYYNKNSTDFITAYDAVDMSAFHAVLQKNLPPRSKILDVGFGSGRDLFYLRKNGFSVWGVDPSEKFVMNVKKRFMDISEHFFISSLPHLEMPVKYQSFFDAIILVAVWMHLPKEEYSASIKRLRNLLKPNGIIVLSYSITERQEEEMRFFEQVNGGELQEIFGDLGFSKVNSTTNADALNDREIVWATEVYLYDQF